MAEQVAERVHSKLIESPPTSTGIRLVSKERKGYAGYYSWVTETGPSDLFFAGRSVLHRIDADIRKRTNERAETMLARRLLEGSRVRVLFVDPRSNLIHRLAHEEKQSEQQMLADIAHSIGVCMRLHKLLENTSLPPSAHLQVCVFDEVPYFAYHHTDDQFIVGFYFASALGHKSGAYEILDPTTKDFFADHFRSILLRSENNHVIRVNEHNCQSELNENLVKEMLSAIQAVLEPRQYEDAVNGG